MQGYSAVMMINKFFKDILWFFNSITPESVHFGNLPTRKIRSDPFLDVEFRSDCDSFFLNLDIL